MNIEETKIINPKTIIFPEVAKTAFVDYIKKFCGSDNPYINFESKRYALAHKMHEILSEVSEGKGDDATNAKALMDFAEKARNNKSNTAILIKNFPVDPQDALVMPPTNPNDYSNAPPEKTGKKGYVTEWSLEAFNTLCGLSPIQAKDMQNGNRYHRIIPQQGKETTSTNAGSGSFPWHTEATYRNDNNMRVMIAGLRNTKTPTVIIAIDEVEKIFKEKFSEKELKILEKPIFIYSNPALHKSDLTCTRAMIRRENGKFVEMQMNGNLNSQHLNEDAAKKHEINIDDAQQVMKKVSHVLSTINQGVVLGHGDLLVLDNLTNLHSRTPIHDNDRKIGQQRHLMRTQSKRDMMVLEKMRKEFNISR